MCALGCLELWSVRIGMLRAVEYVSECYSYGVCFRMLQLWSAFQDVAAVECASGCYSCGVCFRMT